MTRMRNFPRCSGSQCLLRAAVIACGAVGSVVLLALPALAHITVTPDSAQAGSAAVLTFHVPNEEASADTTKLDLRIPTDHPIADLLVEPVPGWNISVRTVTLAKPIVTDDGRFTQAVSEVTWSGGKIVPGQFQDFALIADPLPTGVGSLPFKAVQTYSNGDVVRWIDMPQPGQPAPEHPAPLLTLTSGTPIVGATVTSAASASHGSGPDGVARALAIAALAVAVLGVGGLGAGLRRGKATGG